jgi:hypothetical protein
MGGKCSLCPTFFCSHKYHKSKNYFIFELIKKKNVSQYKNYITLYPQNCHYAFKNIGLGSSGQKGTGFATLQARTGKDYKNPFDLKNSYTFIRESSTTSYLSESKVLW